MKGNDEMKGKYERGISCERKTSARVHPQTQHVEDVARRMHACACLKEKLLCNQDQSDVNAIQRVQPITESPLLQ